MTHPETRVPRRILTRRLVLRAAAAVLLAGILVPQAWAWYQFRAAKSELAKFHPHEARLALDRCLKVWGDRVPVRVLASRSSWQEGDPETAFAEIRRAQRLLDGASQETALEWALIQASAGNVNDTGIEQFLQKQAEQAPATTGPLVWEALAVGYLRAFRTIDAMACLSHWLKREPHNVRALELRGATYVSGKGVVKGTEDFRRVLELDPNRWATRWRLIEGLLALGSYEEAAGHLERFAQNNRDDPAIASRLARCYNMLGRPDEARRVIDGALAAHPDDVDCLRTRGHLAMTSRDPDPVAAEPFLRRAAALAPEDYQSQNLLFQSLQQQGKVEEAKERLKIAEAIRERGERIGELTSRKLAEFPLDPALHYETGKLLLQSSRPESAIGSLQTALQLDPNHKPSHAALAEYYQKRGDAIRAAFHRARAETGEK